MSITRRFDENKHAVIRELSRATEFSQLTLEMVDCCRLLRFFALHAKQGASKVKNTSARVGVFTSELEAIPRDC